MKIKYLILILTILTGIPGFVLSQQPCLQDYLYRRPINITNPSASAISNEVVEITAPIATLIGSSKILPACQDIRFMDNLGNNLEFWIDENNLKSDQQSVWVRINSIPAGGTTIFMFYGNASAISHTNSSIFAFSDDFNSISAWTLCGTPDLINGKIVIGQNEAIVSNQSFPYNYTIEAYIENVDGTGSVVGLVGQVDEINTGTALGYRLPQGRFDIIQSSGACPIISSVIMSTSTYQESGVWSFSWNNSDRAYAQLPNNFNISQNLPAYSNTSTSKVFASLEGSGNITIDWLHVRVLSSVSVSASVGGEEQINPSTELEITGDNGLCTGDTLRLTASFISGAYYSWTHIPSNTEFSEHSNALMVYGANTYSAGAYSVKVTLGIPQCNVKTSQIDVIVSPALNVGSISPDATICYGNNSGSVNLTGLSGSVDHWEYQVHPSSIWNILNTQVTAYDYSNLTQSCSFRAKVSSGHCGSDYTDEASVFVDPTSNGGLLNENKIVCQGTSGTLSLTAQTGSIVNWESNANGTDWELINHTGNSYGFSNIASSISYRVNVKSGVCPAVYSNSVRITVNPNTVGGSVSNGKFVCSGNHKDTLYLVNYTGNILRWEFSPTYNGPWSENTSHTNYFIYQGLTNTTYYRALVESPGCNQVYSVIDTVITETVPVGGILSGSASVCASGNSGTLNLNGRTGRVIGKLRSTDGSSWAHTPHSYDTIKYMNLASNTFYRLIVNTPHSVCTNDTSTSALINVSPVTVSGSLYASETEVCNLGNEGKIRINNETGSVLRWESSLTGSTPWTTIVNTTDSLDFIDLQKTTFYRSVVKSGTCSELIAGPTQIIVDPESIGGTIIGNTEVCELTNSGNIQLINHVGTINQWQYNVNGPTWQTLPNTVSSTVTYNGLIDTTRYRAIVKNGVCPNDTSTISTITVNPLPDVAFTFSNVNLGDPVVFNNQSTISGGSIQSWLWDFGNEQSSASKNPHYVYPNPGTYRVRLTATSNKQCVDSISWPVGVFDLPDVSFTFENICLFHTMNFTNTSGSTAGTTYIWNFGDGTQQVVAPNATHLYTTAKSYTVTLKAISASGGVDSIQKVVTVYQRAIPDFQFEDVCEASVATFANHTTPTSLSMTFFWNFGNGLTDTRTDPETSYSVAGSYLVKLIANTSNGCVDSISRVIQVNPLPVAGFVVEDVPYKQPSVFFNQSTIAFGELNYEWDFGEGEISDSVNPVYIFESPGVYPVTLTATSDVGCKGSVEKPVKIFALPVAKFSFENICNGDSVVFNNESTIPSGTLSYEWDFGDDWESEEVNPSHTYSAIGNYLVRLICISGNNARDTVYHSIIVYDVPVVEFEFNEACDGFPTQFTNTSSVNDGQISNILWDFGDGTNSVQTNPLKEYLNPEIYDVELFVTSSNGCSNSLSRSVIVHRNPVTAFVSSDVCLGFYTGFTNLTTINNSDRPYTLVYQWDFGDQSVSDQSNPTHQYSDPDLYKVMLITSTDAGCADTLVRNIEVFALPNADAGNDTTAVKGFPIILHASGGSSFEWMPSDGLSDVAIASPEARPMETTTYSVRVTDDNGCVNFDTITVFVDDLLRIIPSNILTPNNNGENDTWNIVNIDSYSDAKIQIFDRWGKMVYETNHYNNDWEGLNKNGDILPDGTYYYIIQINGLQNVVYKGAITILRDK